MYSIFDRGHYLTRLLLYTCLLITTAVNLQARGVNPKTGLPSRFFDENPTGGAAQLDILFTGHSRGNIQLAIANNGTFGTYGRSIPDPFTGDPIPSCIFPKNSDLVYLWVAAIWIGAVVGRDTLVSVGDEDFYVTQEFWPDQLPFGEFEYRSIDANSAFYHPEALSEEDIICEYADTLTDPNYVNQDNTDKRAHRPLNIKVTQRSMAWSYSYAEDFILFDYQVENIGTKLLEDVYLGIWVDGDVWHTSRNSPEGWNDDIVGFYRTHPAPEDDRFLDTINVAYHADNDGDPEAGAWDYRSTQSAVGVRVVRTPSDSLTYSFNWWIINYSNASRDFGPRRLGTEEDPFRSFEGRLGTPQGDRNKYYMLSHEEFDYDLIYTALNKSEQGWMPPPEDAAEYAQGYDCRYLLSFGPFDVHPGQKLPISFAWLGGSDFHVRATDFEEKFDPLNPDIYYQSLDFSDLAANSRWASWVYDNPGVDSDSDGYAGKFRVIYNDSAPTFIDTIIDGRDTTIPGWEYLVPDTFYYEGDGIPDFVGAGPPPPPDFWVQTSPQKLTIRFNGQRSETSRDIFSRENDFEGYRVYLGRDDRTTSFSLMASYDLQDYNKMVYRSDAYQLMDSPFTLEELRCLYADSCNDETFDPLRFTRSSPYIHPEFPESTFYFVAQDNNVSELGVDTPIRKRFPHQPYPSSLFPDSARSDELTDDGYLRYFEYEIVIDDLLATVPYWVNVTAFDYGSPKTGLPALESSVTYNLEVAFPQTSAPDVVSDNLEAFVYPNPYRLDGGYIDNGFENRDGSQATARSHLLHFSNLPPKCTISIYSLDGDLIRQIEHDKDPSDPTAMHEDWNLITRNTQAVVSGLYYFVIESELDTQIGKFVIIK